jgi:hypothetical protein
VPKPEPEHEPEPEFVHARSSPHPQVSMNADLLEEVRGLQTGLAAKTLLTEQHENLIEQQGRTIAEYASRIRQTEAELGRQNEHLRTAQRQLSGKELLISRQATEMNAASDLSRAQRETSPSSRSKQQDGEWQQVVALMQTEITAMR